MLILQKEKMKTTLFQMKKMQQKLKKIKKLLKTL